MRLGEKRASALAIAAVLCALVLALLSWGPPLGSEIARFGSRCWGMETSAAFGAQAGGALLLRALAAALLASAAGLLAAALLRWRLRLTPLPGRAPLGWVPLLVWLLAGAALLRPWLALFSLPAESLGESVWQWARRLWLGAAAVALLRAGLVYGRRESQVK